MAKPCHEFFELSALATLRELLGDFRQFLVFLIPHRMTSVYDNGERPAEPRRLTLRASLATHPSLK
jgi:hypothetical protein